MRMRTAASCFALPILVVATLLVATAPAAGAVNAPNAPGAIHLSKGAFKRVGKQIVCGRIGGRWLPGTRRLSYWFFTHTQRARNLERAARHARGAARRRDLRLAKSFRRRAKVERPACGPLHFSLRGASGVAVHGVARPRAGHLSNLEAITRHGKVRAAITSGSANVKQIYQAPSGKVYVLFTQTTQIGGGEPTGNQICDGDSGTSDDTGDDSGDSSDDTADERSTADDTSDDSGDDTGDTSGDGSDDGSGDCEPELTPVIYCLLAELDDKGEPTCVDQSLYSVGLSGPRGNNDPIQFDDHGAIYFASSSTSPMGANAVRRYLDGKLTSYISDPNVLIDDFLVLGDGDVLLSGATLSTGARWVRRVDLDGHVHSVRSVSANFMRLFGDGRAYLGFSAGGSYGVLPFDPATNSFASKYWISGTRNGTAPERDNDVDTMCEGADQSLIDTYCSWFGSRITDSVTTSDKKVFVVAGLADGGRLMQYWPEVKVVPSTVAQVSLATPVGDKIALAGVDANEHRVLVLHDTATDAETPLLGPDDEFDVYHLTYDEKDNTLLFDGLRFSDNRFVLGQVDLNTGKVTFPEASTTRWTAITALR